MQLLFIFLCSCLALTAASENETKASATLLRAPRSYSNLRKDSTSRFDYSNYFDGNDFRGNTKPSRVDDFYGLPEFPAPWTGVVFPNSDNKDLDMTSLMTKLSGLANKKEQGFLSGLLSDPKSAVLSAVVPFVLLLFAVLPYLSSRLSSLGVQEVVSTMASARLGHVLRDPKLVESLARDLAAFASRTFQEEDSCLQRAACEMIVKNGGAKTIANTVRRFSSENWLKTLGMTRIVTALEKRDCKSLCNRPGTKSNSRRKH